MDNEIDEPCPFCGNSDHFIILDFYSMKLGEDVLCVQCEQCEACGPIELEEEIAIQSWNKRFAR